MTIVTLMDGCAAQSDIEARLCDLTLSEYSLCDLADFIDGNAGFVAPASSLDGLTTVDIREILETRAAEILDALASSRIDRAA